MIISADPVDNGLNLISDGLIDVNLETYEDLCDGKIKYLIRDTPSYNKDEEGGKKDDGSFHLAQRFDHR